MRFYSRPEVQVAFVFFIVGVCWIVFSDLFSLQANKNLSTIYLTHLQTIKGSLFVLIVTVLLFTMVKSSHKKLLQSQQSYKWLFEDNPQPMWIYDVQSLKFCKVNHAAIEKYGYTQEEFAEMYITDLWSSHEADKKTMLASGHHLFYRWQKFRHVKKNGRVIICHETHRNFVFDNRPSRLVTVHEITEIVNAKLAIATREQQLDHILDSFSDGFLIIDNELNIVRANTNFKRLIEMEGEAIIGKNLLQIFPAFKDSLFYDNYQMAIRNKQTIHFESWGIKAPEKYYRISAYPFNNGLSIFYRDISTEKLQEEQIRKNEENLFALINNTEDLIWSIDNEYRYFTYNKSYENQYKKYFNEQLSLGSSAINSTGVEQHKQLWKNYYDRALSGEKFSVEEIFAKVNGEKIYTLVSFNPIYNADKKVTGVGCFLHDISNIKIHEEKIQKQNNQLKEIAFITSHSLRAPLTNIMGLAEILDLNDPASPHNLEVINCLKTSAKQLDAVIKDIVAKAASVAEEG